MSLGPVVVMCIFIVWVIGTLRRRFGSFSSYTSESMKTRVYTIASLMSFGLYTGLSTRIFRLFKCRNIHDVYYLTDDYSVTCFDDSWWSYGSVAILCIFLYVCGRTGFSQVPF